MKENLSLFERAKAFIRAHHRRSVWYRIISVLGVFVVFVTTYMLVLPAITMVKGELICGMEEHVHSSDCYTTKYTFTCGQDEESGHEHTDDCITSLSVLTCQIPEHYHEESCYAQTDDTPDAPAPASAEITPAQAPASDDGELVIDNTPEQEALPELPTEPETTAEETETETETEAEPADTLAWDSTTEPVRFGIRLKLKEGAFAEGSVLDVEYLDEAKAAPYIEKLKNQLASAQEGQDADAAVLLPVRATVRDASGNALPTAKAELSIYMENLAGTISEDTLLFANYDAQGVTWEEEEYDRIPADEAESEHLQADVDAAGVFVLADVQYTERAAETEQPTEAVTEQATEAATEQATEAATEKTTEAANASGAQQNNPPANSWGGFGGAGIEEPGIEGETGRTFVQNADGTLQEAGQPGTETEETKETNAQTETESGDETDAAETENESESETENESETEAPAGDFAGGNYMGGDLGLGFEDNGELTQGKEPEQKETENGSETGAQYMYICGLAEHTHTEECYDENGNLVCGLEEHTHTDECIERPMAEGTTTPSPTGKLDTYLTSVTGSGTIVEEDGDYSSHLRFDFSLTPEEIFAENYTLSMTFPDGIVVPDGLLNNTYRGYDTNNNLVFTYSFEKVGDSYKVKVDFDRSYVEGIVPGTDIKCFISFWGELISSKQDENGNFDFRFEQGTELTIPLKDITYTENENFKHDITVTKDGSYLAENNELVYKVVVSSKKGTPGEVTVTDALKHDNFKVKSVKVTVNYPDGHQEEKTFDSDTFTWNLPQLGVNQQYEINYTYTLDDFTGNYNAENSVSVQSGTKDAGDLVIDKAEKNIHVSRSVLSKNGEIRDGKIHWTITVNPQGFDIAGATVTDLKFPGHTAEELNLVIKPEEGVRIQTDGSGNITGLYFDTVENGENHNLYVIEYETDIPSKWANDTENNTATYTKGDQTVSDSAGVNVPGKGDIGKEFVNATEPDENGCIELLWRTTLKVPDENAGSIQIRDWINGGFSPEKHWMTKAQITQMLKDNDWLEEDDLTFSYQWVEEPNIRHYKDLSDDEKIAFFFVNLTEEFCNNHSGEKLILEYKTTCYVGDVVDGTKEFDNVIETNPSGSRLDVKYTYDNRVKVRKMDGDGNSGSSVVDVKDGKLTWKVRILLESDVEECIELFDDLPEGVFLESLQVGYDSLQVTENADGTKTFSHQSWDNVKSTATYNPNRSDQELELRIEKVNKESEWPSYLKENGELLVTYTCTLSDDLKKKIEELEPGQELTVGPFTNKVSVKIDNSKLPYGEDTQTQEGHVKKEELRRLFKGGSWDNGKQLLSYTLDINREGDSLIPNVGDDEADVLTLTDVLTYNEKFTGWDPKGNGGSGANVDIKMNVDLVQDSVKLYYAQKDASGNIQIDSNGNLIPDLKREVPPDVWSWKYTKEGTKATIVASVPDGEAMVLKYDYKVETDAPMNLEVGLNAGNVHNVATIEGFTSAEHSAGSEDKWKDDGTQAGVDVGNTYTFYKIDSSNYSKNLSGAEFTLYKYDPGTGEFVATEKIYTTQNGKFSIFWQRKENEYPDDYKFEKNTLYYVVETKAPEHYNLPAEPTKFYFYFSDSSSEEKNYPENYESLGALDLSLSSYTEYCENAKKEYTYDFEKVDSENPSVKLNGAEFTVFEYRDGTYVSTEKVYSTNEEGKFSISWDEEYKKNTAYYAVETKAPNGYEEPTAEAERYYFHFPDENVEEKAYPSDFPETAKDLSKKDAYSRVENTPLPGLVVEKQWFGGDGQLNTNEEKPDSVKVQLYKKSTNPEQADEKIGIPVTLNEANNWRKEWRALEEGDYYVEEVDIPSGFTVSYKSIIDGVESEEQIVPSNVTAKSGQTIVVANKESGTEIEVEKRWIDGNDGKNNVEVQLYKSTVAPSAGSQNPVDPPKADEITIGAAITNWVDSNGNPANAPQNAGNLWVKVVKCDQGGYSASTGAYENGIKTGELSSSNGWSFTTTVPKDGYYILQFGTHGNANIDEVCVPGEDETYKPQHDLQVPSEGKIYNVTAKLKSSASTTPTPTEPTAGKKVTVKITDGLYSSYYDPTLVEGYVTGDTAEVRIVYDLYKLSGEKIEDKTFTKEDLVCEGGSIEVADPVIKQIDGNCVLCFTISGLLSYQGECSLIFDGKNSWPQLNNSSIIDTNPISPVSANFSMPIVNSLGTPITNTQVLPDGAEEVGDPVILGSSQNGKDGYTNGGWGYQWKDLPRANESGQKLYYYVVETENGGSASTTYEYDYERNSAGEIVKVSKVTITNTPPTEEEKVSVTVKKEWKDKNGNAKTSNLPEEIEVKLYGSGNVEKGSATLNASNEWTHTWSDLPKDTYWVEEVDPSPNYRVTYSKETEEGNETASAVTTTGNETITITNQDDSTEIEVEKVWANGSENHIGDFVTMELYRSTTPPETEAGPKEPEPEPGTGGTDPVEPEPNPEQQESVTENVTITISIDEWLPSGSAAPSTGWAWVGIFPCDNNGNVYEGDYSDTANLIHTDGNATANLSPSSWSRTVTLPGKITTGGTTEIKYYRVVIDDTPWIDETAENEYPDNPLRELAFSNGQSGSYIIVNGSDNSVNISLTATLAGETGGTGGTEGSSGGEESEGTGNGTTLQVLGHKHYGDDCSSLPVTISNGVATVKVKYTNMYDGATPQTGKLEQEDPKDSSISISDTPVLESQGGGIYYEVFEVSGLIKPGDYKLRYTYTGDSGDIWKWNSIIIEDPYAPNPAPASYRLSTPTMFTSAPGVPINTSLINASPIRPEGATKMEGKDVVLNKENNWYYKWDNLPKTDEDGNTLYYYVVEKDLGEGYKTTYAYDYVENDPTKGISKVTVTNTPPEKRTTSVSVQKVWQNEKGEPKNAWLKSIEVELLNSTGGHVDVTNNPVILNADNRWSYTWPDLPEGTYYVRETNTGETVTYTVKYSNSNSNGTESETPEGAAVTAGIITITNQSTSVSVDKKWVDKNGDELTSLEGKEVKVQLYRVKDGADDEKVGEPVALNGNGEFPWYYEWSNLPLGEYYVVEEPEVEGFTALYTNSAESTEEPKPDLDLSEPKNAKVASGTITITNYEDTEIEVEKVWADKKDNHEPIRVKLYSSTTPPNTDIVGKNKETASIASTMKLSLGVTDWVDDDKNEAEPITNGSVWMTVQACDSTGEPLLDENGEAVVYANRLTASNNWHQTTQELPATVTNENGETETKYYLLRFGSENADTQNGIQGLSVLNGPNETNGIVISGNASKDGKLSYNLQATVAGTGTLQPRIDNTRMMMLNSGEGGGDSAETTVDGLDLPENKKKLDEVTLKEGNAFGSHTGAYVGEYGEDSLSFKWQKLPTVNESGERLYYYVEEVSVSNYNTKYAYEYEYADGSVKGVKLVTITNTPNKISIMAKKEWKWNGQKPTGADESKFSVALNLMRSDDGKNWSTCADKTLTNNNWSVTWTDLDAGYMYKVVEFSVQTSPYTFTPNIEYSWGNETIKLYDNGTVTVTNTYNPTYYTLPETGGTGTLPYTVGGVLLTALATLLLYIQNKRRKEGQGTS